MFSAAPLALLLLAAVPDEGRGTAGTIPEETLGSRTAPRIRAGLGGALLFGLANYSAQGGLGLSLEVGTVIDDRFAVFLHAEVATLIISLAGSGALVAEYVLSEHFSAGLGVAFSAWAPIFSYGGNFYGLTFPLRINWAPVARSANETGRKGLLIGLQVAPGFSLQPTNFPQFSEPLPPDPAVSATLSVSYAWW